MNRRDSRGKQKNQICAGKQEEEKDIFEERVIGGVGRRKIDREEEKIRGEFERVKELEEGREKREDEREEIEEKRIKKGKNQKRKGKN